jgi:anti-sigma factor RsiW
MVDFLMDYVNGELPSAQHESFEGHLAACSPCIAYLESYRETVRLGREVCCGPGDQVPDDVPPELIEAILSARLSGSA